MRIKWGNENTVLTLTAGNSFDKLYLSIVEKQVCDRGVYVKIIESRLTDTQKKMHAKCNEVLQLRAELESKTIIGWIRRFLSI